jgi:peptide/nickel transport system substrate-binding protein
MNAKQLTIAKSGVPVTLDPAFAQSGNELTFVGLAYETLINLDPQRRGGGPAFLPGLAHTWHSNPAGDRWTFVLSQRHFADGRPIDGEAVKQSLERLASSGSFGSRRLGMIHRISVPRPEVVEIELSRRSSTFLCELAASYASIVSPGAFFPSEQALLSRATAGSGPFQVLLFDDRQIVMRGNRFHPELIGDERIVFPFVVDSRVRRRAVESGQFDVVENLSLEDVQVLEGNASIEVITERSSLLTYLSLNCMSKAFASGERRAAFADYLAELDLAEVFGPRAVALTSYVPMGLGPVVERAMTRKPPMPSQSERVRQLFSDQPLRFLVDYPGNQSYWSDVTHLVSQALGKLGVKVDIDRVRYETMRRKIEAGDFDVTVGDWNLEYADRAAVLNYWLHSRYLGLAGNTSRYQNPFVDRLLDEADAAADCHVRDALMVQAQTLAQNECPYIPIVQRHFHFAYHTRVRGVARTDSLGWQGLSQEGVIRYFNAQART